MELTSPTTHSCMWSSTGIRPYVEGVAAQGHTEHVVAYVHFFHILLFPQMPIQLLHYNIFYKVYLKQYAVPFQLHFK